MKVTSILPFFFGEPFLDKKIYSRVARIKERFPLFPTNDIMLFSNLGVPINEAEVEKLRGIDVVISYTDDADNEIRDHNVKLLKDTGIAMYVHFVCEDILTSLALNAAKFSMKHGLQFQGFGKYNWAGKIKSNMSHPDGHCCRPRRQIVVMWDGRVNLCCMDSDGEVILGDVRTSSLKEIWESNGARMYREKKKSELDLCKICNMQLDDTVKPQSSVCEVCHKESLSFMLEQFKLMDIIEKVLCCSAECSAKARDNFEAKYSLGKYGKKI